MSLRSAEDEAITSAPLQHSILRSAGLRVVWDWEHERWRRRAKQAAAVPISEQAAAQAAEIVDSLCLGHWRSQGLRVVPESQAAEMAPHDWTEIGLAVRAGRLRVPLIGW